MILVTGASGFVGSTLFALGRGDLKAVFRATDEVTFSDGYLVDSIDGKTVWDGAFDNVNTIIHLAGLAHSHSFSSKDYNRVNVAGTLRLATKAAEAGVQRLVFVSSIGVNGASTSSVPFSAVSELTPHNCYAQSKLDAELGLADIAAETGLELVVVRPTLVYGAHAPGNFCSLSKLVSKLPFLPFGFANNKRDFISVNNLADLLVTCATHPNAAGHTFLASDSETVSIKEFTNAIAKGLGKKVIQLPVPVTLMRLAGKLTGKSAMIEQLYGNLEVDSSNIKEVLGWTPPFTMEQSMALLKQMDK
ncbi:UDP-glucose 4-epimerase [Vibrio vulnificus]|uniref:NAD-dependent epimerase/dehydratase family protein n=1 Tax=Vibrio vulnificus TaxID=672 RepID=UPI0009B6A958|nr:NAD-dependent epimerase/dehydratase family protein [Vibrio vulnificus]OQK66536.1 UDP-glucose 4-epimerase [Vibrio vulnificus]OQK68092.1 UDP-glucose 4-epimerase [Vibrio vulnificus]